MATPEITYICKRTTVSTKPVQPGKYFHFSVLDRLMERNHIRIVYYYRSREGRDASQLIKTLRNSLSETLSCFPIIVGRLQKNDGDDQWRIKCNDAGVRMVEARVKGTVEEWLKNVDREKELKLVHWEEMFHKPYFWSTFYVQLTEFENGGLAVGLSCFHLLADPICATMFIKAWADTNLPRKMLIPPIFHPLPPRRLGNKTPDHTTYTELIENYKSAIERSIDSILISTTNPKQVTVSLSFTGPMVQACIDMAKTPDATSPSPFEALAGLFWVCISKVKGFKGGLLDMSICLDMRKVLRLDQGYFGNCMVYNKVNVESTLDVNELLSQATWAIQEVVTKMDNEGIMDLIEWLENYDNKNRLSHTLMNGCNLICANLDGLSPFSTTFEDGFEPSRVSYYVEPVLGIGQILVIPSHPSDGPLGRVVMVTLSEDEAVMLCEDDLILRFSPTILMGINKNG